MKIFILIGEPYDPYSPRIIPPLVFYSFLIILGLLFTYKLLKRSKVTNNISGKLLGRSILFFTISLFILFIGLLEVIITREFREIYRLSQLLAFIFSIFGNLELVKFGKNLFKLSNKAEKIFKILFTINLFTISLYENRYGVPNYYYEGEISTRIYTSLFLLVTCLSLYLYIIKSIILLHTKEILIKKAYNIIKYAFICFVLFWVFILLDSIYIIITTEGFSIFFFIAWIFALLFWFLSYNATIMPNWLRNKLLNEKT